MLRLFRLCAVALALVLPGRALAEPAMWTIRDADSTIILFGSVHMLPPRVDWASARLKQALGSADEICFEIAPDDATAAEVSRLAADRAWLPPGQSLFRMLPAADRRRLRTLAALAGLTPAQVARLQPWMAEVQLMVGVLQRRGATRSDGVEAQISAMAPQQAGVCALETPAQQIGFLAGGSRAAQLQSLRETLRELSQDPHGFDRTVTAWVKGDVRALAREVIAPLRKAAPATYRALVVDRNRIWTNQIAARLDGAGTTVMVVGAGHLVGPDGVPAMLRRRGLVVEGP